MESYWLVSLVSVMPVYLHLSYDAVHLADSKCETSSTWQTLQLTVRLTDSLAQLDYLGSEETGYIQLQHHWAHSRKPSV